jgi:hypothetical protein
MKREVRDGEQFQALLREHLRGSRLVQGSRALAGRSMDEDETAGESARNWAKGKAGE